MLITKDMVGKTVYCIGSQPHRNYHPAKLERVVTKVGRKFDGLKKLSNPHEKALLKK